MESLFESLVDLNNSFNKVHPLAAIWLSSPVWLEDKRTVRIEAGNRLRIEDNRIVNASIPDKPATHIVTGCFGNISDTVLYFELVDLKTAETTTLSVKSVD